MTSPSDNWRPTPELLAAYFDGECEGRDDLCHLKQRIENWLAANPRAQEELADQRRLMHLWQETAPPEPRPEQWSLMLARLEALVTFRCPTKKTRSASGGIAVKPFRRAGLVGAAAAVVAGLAVYLASNPASRESNQPVPVVQAPVADKMPDIRPAPTAPEDEIFPVAHASEVTIVRVEGADTHTLVVGELPLQGSLELAAPGDVILTLIRSDARGFEENPVRLIENSSPMIWAKLETETED